MTGTQILDQQTPCNGRAADIFLRVVILLAVSGILALLASFVHPRRIPWIGDWEHHIEAMALEEGIPLVNTAEIQRLLESGSHIILDARPIADYDAGHIPRALPLPYDDIEPYYDQVHLMLTPDQPIVAYCSGGTCDDSLMLCVYLRKQGFTNTILYAEGWTEWQKMAGAE